MRKVWARNVFFEFEQYAFLYTFKNENTCEFKVSVQDMAKSRLVCDFSRPWYVRDVKEQNAPDRMLLVSVQVKRVQLEFFKEFLK